MSDLRNRAGMLLYAAAVMVSVLGTGYLVWIHLKLWLAGNFVLGAFSVVLVLEYLLASLVLWALGSLLSRRTKWDFSLLLLTIIPIALLLVAPARFAAN
ncbi:hypothetical protein [Roseateles sp. P5_E11]|jgi:hypothetical protein